MRMENRPYFLKPIFIAALSVGGKLWSGGEQNRLLIRISNSLG